MNRLTKPSLLAIYASICIIFGVLIGYVISGKTLKDSPHMGANDKIHAVLQLIGDNYVDKVDIDSIAGEAIVNLLSKLDPHSVYVAPVDFKQENDYMQGNFDGIGIQFRIQEDTVIVVQTIQGGPSSKVGIMAGDRILKVDDTVICNRQMPDSEIMKRIKGKKGSKVKITIQRKGIPKLMNFNVVRDVIKTYSLDYKGMLDSRLGYIKLNSFTATTYDEFVAALNELQILGMKELILDLRNNGGGYLDQAIKIADEFLPKGDLIVYTEGRKVKHDEFYATAKGEFEKGNLYVLIDEFSASASEIVAGAIQDNDRGIVIGRRSFGKGLVQEQFEFKDGSALRLTVARYHTPSGRCIQRSYKKGSLEYYESYVERVLTGVQENDSLLVDNGKAFKTKKGRKVYGGGGISPDIYIPYQRDSLVAYYNKLISKGVLHKYSFEYADAHRKQLKAYSSQEYINNFVIDDIMFNEFVSYAEKNGVKANINSLTKYKKDIKTMLKALISQSLYEKDDVFYKIYLSTDNDLKKTIDIARKPK